MTKQELIIAISIETHVDKVTIRKVVDSFLGTTINSLKNNENVYLRGFGTFLVVKKSQKTARDIRKNIPVIIPEHYAPKFKPVKAFVDVVRNNVKN